MNLRHGTRKADSGTCRPNRDILMPKWERQKLGPRLWRSLC